MTLAVCFVWAALAHPTTENRYTHPGRATIDTHTEEGVAS